MAVEVEDKASAAGDSDQAAAPSVTLLWHRGYSESKLVKAELDKQDVRYRARDVFELPLSREEIEILLEGEDDIRPFLNARASEYRDRAMDARTPPRDMAVELMTRDLSLLQLPILLRGAQIKVTPTPEDALAFLGIDPKAKAKAAAAAKAKAAAAAKAKAAAAKKGAGAATTAAAAKGATAAKGAAKATPAKKA